MKCKETNMQRNETPHKEIKESLQMQWKPRPCAPKEKCIVIGKNGEGKKKGSFVFYSPGERKYQSETGIRAGERAHWSDAIIDA